MNTPADFYSDVDLLYTELKTWFRDRGFVIPVNAEDDFLEGIEKTLRETDSIVETIR